MIVPDGATFHYNGNVYAAGAELPKELERFIPDHLKKAQPQPIPQASKPQAPKPSETA